MQREDKIPAEGKCVQRPEIKKSVDTGGPERKLVLYSGHHSINRKEVGDLSAYGILCAHVATLL